MTGLRTLLLAERYITIDEYEEWEIDSAVAKRATENREELVAESDSQIEVDLTLVGSTAIEDKLQDDVNDTLKSLKNAGIKIWVLTGDKVETA